MEDLAGKKLYYLLYEGQVIDVEDPDQSHRIRADIPGLCSESAWARPKTMAGGGPQRGGNAVPPVGSTVFITFVLGNINDPVYEGGSWGKPDVGSELPIAIQAAKSDADEVAAWEFSRKDTITGIVRGFRFTIDERKGHGSFKFSAFSKPVDPSKPEQTIGSIELDLENRVLEIFATAGVQILSNGFVDIRALAARIQRRRVHRSAAPL